MDLIQCRSIAVLWLDYNIRFWLQVAIAKELSQQPHFMYYKHGVTDFARRGMYQISISFNVADCLKVSLNTVQNNSLNSIMKLVL